MYHLVVCIIKLISTYQHSCIYQNTSVLHQAPPRKIEMQYSWSCACSFLSKSLKCIFFPYVNRIFLCKTKCQSLDMFWCNNLVCRHSSWVASPKANLHIKSGLVQVVEWPWTGVKPLSAPMSTVFPCSNLSMSWIELPSLYKCDRFLCIDKCVCTLKVILMDMY